MSRKFLDYLNNSKKDNNFAKILEELPDNPRIAWYPSAGTDFRALLYLNATYEQINPAKVAIAPPDVFIYSDYYPWSRSNFLDDRIIYEDEHTKIEIECIEEINHLDLILDDQIVDFSRGSVATGRVIFLQILAESDKLGSFRNPLVYAFVENAAFCATVAIPNLAFFSHIIKIRYGGGCGGGGKSSGVWLHDVLDHLETHVFVTDNHDSIQRGDHRVRELFPELRPREKNSYLEPIRTIPWHLWSNYGEVTWNLVKKINSNS